MASPAQDTVPGLLAAVAAARPDATAAICGESRLTFAALETGARRAAHGLAQLGVGPGDRVALWLPNGIEWLVLYLACQQLGAVTVAVNTRFRSAEVEDILGRSGAKLLALEPGFKGIDFAGIIADVNPSALDALSAVVVCGAGTVDLPGRKTVGYDSLVARPPLDRPAATPESGSVIFTTSGTTRAPKFVLLDQRAIAGHAGVVARGFGYVADGSVLLQALPLCGTFGLAQAMGTLAAGGPMVLLPAFDAAAAAGLIARHRVTQFNASDEMIQRLMDTAQQTDLYSIQWIGYASFANPEARTLVDAADARGLTLAGLYGMSEVQALFARQPEDGPAELRALAGGRPTSPAAEVRVRDPESGRLLPVGEAGELELKGPSMFREYYGDAAATAEALTEDGFVRTGDLARRTEDGFVFLTRMGDSLRLGGFLVSPGEIDAWVERHPTVDACQTVAVEGGRGPVPVAFVLPRSGAAVDEAALIAHCAQGLAKFKVPARILAIDAFPVTESANGVKIQRGRLREMARGFLAERPAD